MSTPQEECPSDKVMALVQIASGDDTRGLAEADRLLQTYPGDARLHFLRGSLLASLKRYNEARASMARAVDLAPGFAIARFQYGLLQWSSGEMTAAESTWAPLQSLPADAALRLFATGLNHISRDEFAPAFERLREGIAHNSENPALNRDMQMVIEEAQRKLAEQVASGEPTSAAQMLLQDAKRTRH